MNLKKFSILVLTYLFIAVQIFAQSSVRPALEREVSLKISNENVESVLKKIEQQSDLRFSYSSVLINTKQIVNLNATKKTVREVINILFNGKVSAKSRGNYVILTAASPEIKKDDFIILSGYITNEETGDKVPSVSIFNKTKFVSTVSNTYGFFSIKIQSSTAFIQLNVSKENFRDTIIAIKPRRDESLIVSIQPLRKEEEEIKTDSTDLEYLPMINFLVDNESAINSKNIKDTLYSKYQVSLIPTIGTNYRLSGNVINDYSFNIIGGYSLGIRKAEFAGIFNIDRGDVGNVQMAGFGNAVGGNVKGLQAAGCFNLNRGNTKGIQLAGFGNVVWGNAHAAQFAGFFNLNKGKTKAIQMAGFVNANLDTSSGAQFAGFVNTVVAPYDGLQASGFVNVATRKVKGVQASGFVNIAVEDLNGTQLSGFFNYAHHVKGTQIGFLNYSDSCNGIPIGFLSFVNHGYHKIEISADEIFYTNIAFRTGVKAFHNIIFAGMRPDYFNHPLWHFGYGAGTTVSLSKKVALDFDLTSQHISKGNFTEKTYLLNKATLDVDVQLGKKFSIATGPVLNVLLSDNDATVYPQLFDNLKPHTFYSEKQDKDYNLEMWMGWKFALRFL